MQIFITNVQELDGRLDCDYYQPHYRDLEKKILEKSSTKVKDYVLNIAGGATPSKKKPKKYYTESKDKGVPLLRVQNVSEKGLILDNCVFINENTHNGLLKRSQVKEDYLITKITGVGRMAVSSVAPKGFEGNINQHLVAIKTENREISECLATFLNSDIGEKLASRRSTGGTRPALDYQALLSIPVILDKNIVRIKKSAIEKCDQLLSDAKKIEKSIDSYILKEIGIKTSYSEKKKIFTINSNQLKSGRIDPIYFMSPQDSEISSSYSEKRLSEIADLCKGQSISKKNIIPGKYPVIAGGQTTPYSINKFNFDGETVTISASGAYSGFVWYHDYPIFASDCIVINSKDKKEIFTFYLYCVLKSKQNYIYNMQRGAGQPHVYIQDLSKLRIPIPPLSIQKKISKEIKNRIEEIESLKNESEEFMREAKTEIEKLILE